jgi:hypothetical protein
MMGIRDNEALLPPEGESHEKRAAQLLFKDGKSAGTR